MKLFALAVAMFVTFCTASISARAADIQLNQWYTFTFDGIGSSFFNGDRGQLGTDPISLDAPDPAWTFSLSSDAELIVVDGEFSGDQFQVTDNGIDLGDTSSPTAGGFCSNDIAKCLADPQISSGSFLLLPGSQSVDGTAIKSPFGGGEAFFEVRTISAAPEPYAWLLMIAGIGVVGLMFRRIGRKTRLKLKSAYVA